MLSEYSKELQSLPSNMTVQILIVFEIWRFCDFFKKIFRKLILIFFHKIWNSQPCSWVLSECSQRLRILPPNMTAHILVVFEISFWDFFKKFQKILISFLSKFEIPSLVVGCCQSTFTDGESCLQIWLLNSCSFRDMMFFVIFQNFFRKLIFIFRKIWLLNIWRQDSQSLRI